MDRRQASSALVALPFSLLWSPGLGAQSKPGVTIIGLLDAGERTEWWDAFRQKLRELGYAEGRNVKYELRYAKGNLDTLPSFARDLVQLKAELIVTSGAPAAIAAQRATTAIPIVMATGTDQVSLGLAQSLARPGGNVTGLASLSSGLMAKRFELLREVLPKSSRVGALWHADNAPSMAAVRDVETAASASKVAFQSFGVRNAEQLPEAFWAMTREHIDALIVVTGAFIFDQRKKVVELALKYKVPTMCGAAEYVEVGGLMSYAPSYPEMFRHAAVYVDKILRGAKPADMPIEQPTVVELWFNLKTAKALGVTIPQSLLVRADHVIQ